MTQDNAMAVDTIELEDDLERALTEVTVLTNAVVDAGETIRGLNEKVDYLEYLLTRKEQQY